jgi:hypothetical protein
MKRMTLTALTWFVAFSLAGGDCIAPADDITLIARTIYNDGNLAAPDSVRVIVTLDGTELTDSWYNSVDAQCNSTNDALVFFDQLQDIDGAGGDGVYAIEIGAYDQDSTLYTWYYHTYTVGIYHAIDLDDVNGTLDASEIGTDAITASKIAADAIGASELANAAINDFHFSASAITSSVIAVNAIGSSQIAANAIGASEIADDAIDYATFAGTAPTAWWNEDKTGYTVSTVSDKTGYSLTTAERGAIEDSIHAQAADYKATGFSTHSAADAADAVWNEDTTGHYTDPHFGYLAVQAASGTWNSTQRDSVLAALQDASIGDKVWTDATTRTITGGTVADVTNQVTADVTAISSSSTAANMLEDAFDDNATSSASLRLDLLQVIGNNTDASFIVQNSGIGDAVRFMHTGTNGDGLYLQGHGTGYAANYSGGLSAAKINFGGEIADAVWDEDTTGHYDVGKYGYEATSGTGTTPAAVWSYANRELTDTTGLSGLDVNVVSIAGTAAAATNLEDAFDGDATSSVEMQLKRLSISGSNPGTASLAVQNTAIDAPGMLIYSAAGGSGNALQLFAQGTGHAFYMQADGTGSAIYGISDEATALQMFGSNASGNGHGMRLEGGGTGSGFYTLAGQDAGETGWGIYAAGGLAGGDDVSWGGLVADSVWDETAGGHTVSGTYGKYLDTEVSGIGSGSGMYSITVQAYDSSLAESIPNTRLAVRNFDQTALMGLGVTDSQGRTGFNLDADSFLVVSIATSYTFAGSDTLVVTGSGVDTVFGVRFDPGTPASPELCRVFGYVVNVQGVSETGATVSAYLPRGVALSGSLVVSPYMVSTQTDSLGYFFIDLIPSDSLTGDDTRYEISISRQDGTVLRKRISVPATSNWQLVW